MQFIDRCIFNATAGGLTDWSVASAVLGFMTPVQAGAVIGQVYSYSAQSADLTQWEEGQGPWNGAQLARSTIFWSSTGGGKVVFTSAPQVSIQPLAEDLIFSGATLPFIAQSQLLVGQIPIVNLYVYGVSVGANSGAATPGTSAASPLGAMIVISLAPNAGTISSVVDSVGNTYSLARRGSGDIWYSLNANALPVGGTFTATISGGANYNVDMATSVVGGISLDQTGGNHTNSASTNSISFPTLSAAPEILFVRIGPDNFFSTYSGTPGFYDGAGKGFGGGLVWGVTSVISPNVYTANYNGNGSGCSFDFATFRLNAATIAAYLPTSVGIGTGLTISGGAMSASPVPPNCVNIQDFFTALGGDNFGSSDCTAAINAAFATFLGKAGTVIIPAGTYKITSEIYCGVGASGVGGGSFISVWAPGGGEAVLSYQGGNNKSVFRISKNHQFVINGLNVRNDGGATGCTGITLGSWDGGSDGDTTQTNDGTLINFGVGGFATGMSDGPVNGACSEITFINAKIGNNTVAWTSSFFNTLDLIWIDPQCNQNKIAFQCFSPNMSFYGGSMSGNDLDFQVGGAGAAQTITINNIRTELASTFMLGTAITGGGTNVSIYGSQINLGRANSRAAITGQFSSLVVDSSYVEGYIYVGAGAGSQVRITNCAGWADPRSTGLIVGVTGAGFTGSPGAGQHGPAHLVHKNNTLLSTSPVSTSIFDYDGSIGIVGNGEFKNFTGAVANSNPQSDYQFSVLTVSALGSGSGVLVPGCVIDGGALPSQAYILDQLTGTPGGIGTYSIYPPGTTQASASLGSSYGFSAIFSPNTLIKRVGVRADNVPLDFQTLNSVKSIGEGPPPGLLVTPFTTTPDTTDATAAYGVPLQGANLRIAAKFASAATVAATFNRAVTIGSLTGADGNIIHLSSGTFTWADVGKHINVPTGGAGGTNWDGIIVGVNSSTAALVVPAPTLPPLTSAAAGTIGDNEPDGNYGVWVQAEGANETFSISAKATTGFTVTSSNASSTAQVYCLIVR